MALSDKFTIHDSSGPYPEYAEGVANDYVYGNNLHKLGIVGDVSTLTFLTPNELTHNNWQYRSVLLGTNEYLFTNPSAPNRWVGLYFNGYNATWLISALKLIFSTGEKISINDAIAQNYIYSSVAISTWTHWDYYQNGWIDEWNNIVDLADGETVTVGHRDGKCREALFMFRMKSATVNLIGFEFCSTSAFYPSYDRYTGGTSGLCAFMQPVMYNITFIPKNRPLLTPLFNLKKVASCNPIKFEPVRLKKVILNAQEPSPYPDFPYWISWTWVYPQQNVYMYRAYVDVNVANDWYYSLVNGTGYLNTHAGTNKLVYVSQNGGDWYLSDSGKFGTWYYCDLSTLKANRIIYDSRIWYEGSGDIVYNPVSFENLILFKSM